MPNEKTPPTADVVIEVKVDGVKVAEATAKILTAGIRSMTPESVNAMVRQAVLKAWPAVQVTKPAELRDQLAKKLT